MKHEFSPSQEELERTARNSRQYTRKLADKIEQSEEPLNAWERRWAAEALRTVADTIQATPQAAAGRPVQIPVHDAVMEVALLMCFQDMKKTPAIEQVAEKYGVTSENIRKHFNKIGQEKIDFIKATK